MFHLIIFILYFVYIYTPLFGGGELQGPRFYILGVLVYFAIIFVVGWLGPLENSDRQGRRRRNRRYYD